MLPAIGLVLVVSAGVGLLNGLLVTRLRVNAFIATLGVGLLLKGYLDNGYDGPAGKTAPALVQTPRLPARRSGAGVVPAAARRRRGGLVRCSRGPASATT